MNILDKVINRLPLISLLDGHKTKVAGTLAAIGAIAGHVAPFLPPEYAAPTLAASELLLQLAGYSGIYGLTGKAVKIGRKK